MQKRTLADLKNDKRGAVLVEFLVAVMPLMITFSCFVQVSSIATARIVVKHSAIVGARAAAVIANGNKNTPDQPQGDNKGEITNGVRAALGPWVKTMNNVDVQINDQSSCSDPYGMVSVTVTADYRCSVPFGGRLLCGAVGATHTLKQTYAMPHQGARYKDGDGASCDGGGGGFVGGGGRSGGGGASGTF
ncbi:MAG: hypothetical protein KF819_19630 [Labilithrix sp.]|nr:hypothetical protein [Labilithrix sp.]